MRTGVVRGLLAVLVLALGIALGAGPLQHSARERDRQLDAKQREVARAQERIETLTATGKYGSDYAQNTAATLIAGKLTGRSIALIQLPGASPTLVDAIAKTLTAAGASITAEATLDDALAGPGSRQLVDALTSQMATQNPSLGITTSASAYERFGLLLARAVAADRGSAPSGSAYDQTAVGLVAGLEAANLVDVGKVAPRGAMTVFVSGPPARTDTAAAANAVPVTVMSAFGTRTPTLLAGTAAAAGKRGVLGELRADRTASSVVSGVDSIDTPMGRVAVVLALAARIGGKIGQYGGVGAANGPVPQ